MDAFLDMGDKTSAQQILAELLNDEDDAASESGPHAEQVDGLRVATNAMRLALGIEYDGSGFSGWQRLTAAGTLVPDGSLQTALEIALSRVAGAPIDTVCAGRTDAGTGQCQVVHGSVAG